MKLFTEGNKTSLFVFQYSKALKYANIRMPQNKLLCYFSLLSVGFFISSTPSHFRLTKKQAVILDHWGKGSPSAAETAVLDIEVGILKAEEMEAQRKLEELERKKKLKEQQSKVSKNNVQKANKDLQFGDVLMIDGKPVNGESQTTVPVLDTRVD